MNPFQVLGLHPDAAEDQIEATYRSLLRAHHPDLHQGASPDELAEAERRTQELNQAMALIRAGWRPQPGGAGDVGFADRPRSGARWAPPQGAPATGYDPPPPPGAWSRAYRADETTDFFGNPRRRRRGPDAVACPLCGTEFDEAPVLRLHLVHHHGLHDDVFPGPRPPRARRDRFAWLRWVPLPQVSLTALLFVYLVVVDGLIAAPWSIAGLWLGFGIYGAAMLKAMSQRRAT